MLTRAAGVAQGFSPAGAAMARTRVACTLRMLSLAALTLASPSVQHASAPPQSTVADARSLVDAGKLDEAEQLLRRHLVTEPHSPDGDLLLWVCPVPKDPGGCTLPWAAAGTPRRRERPRSRRSRRTPKGRATGISAPST